MRRLGRRGAYLLLSAFIYLGHGIAFLLAPTTPAARTSLAFALALAPLKVWGIFWLVAGVIAAVSAFRRGPRSDRWGFYALIVMATCWASIYLAAAVLGSGTRFANGAIAAMLYGSLAGVILIVSGWPEPGARDQE